MILQGIRNDKPVAIPVDENGRLLVSTNSVGIQAVSITDTVAVSIAETVTMKPAAITSQNIAISVGTPVIINPISYPLTIRATPGAGGTITVEDRGSAQGEFHNLPLPTASPGVFSAYGCVKCTGPIEALRFTATVADGIVEITQ